MKLDQLLELGFSGILLVICMARFSENVEAELPAESSIEAILGDGTAAGRPVGCIILETGVQLPETKRRVLASTELFLCQFAWYGKEVKQDGGYETRIS